MISAIFEQSPYLFKTAAWYCGADSSFIEFDTKNITPQQLNEVEQRANEIIRNGNKVTVVAVNDSIQNLSEEVHTFALFIKSCVFSFK